MQYYLKLKANPDNPAYNLVFHPQYETKFLAKPREIPPFALRISGLMEEAGININNIMANTIPNNPVWVAPEPTVLFNLTWYEKSSTAPEIYRTYFYQLLNKYKEFCPIYTDGSKQQEKVACAFVTPYSTSAVCLPDNASIYTAEAVAILRALNYCEVSLIQNFIICSDSLSVLQAIENQECKNPIISSLLEQLYIALNARKNIIFCWIPGHSGIAGNETADQAAKAAITNGLPNVLWNNISIPCSDFIPRIKPYLNRKWQLAWDESHQQRPKKKLCSTKPVVNTHSVHYKNRKEHVILTRLRLGHTRLTHAYLIEREPAPICHYCNDTVTVKHILIDCPELDQYRRQYYTQIHSMEDLFKNISHSSIINYLKTIGAYHRL